MQSVPQKQQPPDSLDGVDAGDNDQSYCFGRQPRSSAPFPFTTRQYVHLLVLRSRVQDGLIGSNDLRGA